MQKNWYKMKDKPIEINKGHLIDKVHKGIRFDNEKNRKGHETKKHWSPTDSSKCPRALWYAWKGFPVEYTDEELAVFSIGNFTHEFLQKILQNTGVQLCAEYRIDVNWKGFPVAGFVDSIIFDKKEGLCVVDFKTIRSSGMPFVRFKAKIEHNKQLQMYMDILKIKKGYILYWDKESGDMLQQEVKYEPKLIKEIEQLFKLVQHHLDKNTLPNSKYDENNWKCRYCKFKEYCKKDYFL